MLHRFAKNKEELVHQWAQRLLYFDTDNPTIASPYFRILSDAIFRDKRSSIWRLFFADLDCIFGAKCYFLFLHGKQSNNIHHDMY